MANHNFNVCFSRGNDFVRNKKNICKGKLNFQSMVFASLYYADMVPTLEIIYCTKRHQLYLSMFYCNGNVSISVKLENHSRIER